jgi:hypothetical protein
VAPPGPPWEEFSIRIPERHANEVATILKGFSRSSRKHGLTGAACMEAMVCQACLLSPFGGTLCRYPGDSSSSVLDNAGLGNSASSAPPQELGTSLLSFNNAKAGFSRAADSKVRSVRRIGSKIALGHPRPGISRPFEFGLNCTIQRHLDQDTLKIVEDIEEMAAVRHAHYGYTIRLKDALSGWATWSITSVKNTASKISSFNSKKLPGT